MKKFFLYVLAAVLLVMSALAQTLSSSAKPSTKLLFAPGTIIRVELAKSIDAKKSKVGDEVAGKTMDDFLTDKNEVLAPKGSKILAHVAEVTPHQGDSASTLGFLFDKMILKDGSEVPLKVVIQAIGPPETNAALGSSSMGDPATPGGMLPMPSGGRGGNDAGTSMGSGGKANAGNNTAITQDSSSPASEATINGRLTPNAKGVVGMSGLSLSVGSAQDSLLTSQKHNVKLDSGTQMILRVVE
jgi:hypothetical protein